MRRRRWCAIATIALAMGSVAARQGTGSGPILRTIPVGSGAVAIAADGSTGRIFVADRDSRDIRVLDASTGDVLQQIGLGNYRYAPPGVSLPLAPVNFAVDKDWGRVYVATNADELLDLDARSGLLRGVVRTTGLMPITAMAAYNGRIFVVGIGAPSTGIQLDMLDSRSGHLLHATPLGGAHSVDGVANFYHGGGIVVSARTGRVFVGSMTRNALHVLRLNDGVSLGAVRVGTLTAPPVAEAIDDQTQHMFVVTDAGNSVDVCDARTGAALRHVLVGPFPVAIAVDGRTHRAFVVNLGLSVGSAPSAARGSVAVIDTRTGALLTSVGVGVEPEAVAIDVRRGRVFIVNTGAVDGRGTVIDPGSVTVLDARSGAVRATLSVGLAPTAIAVDEVTARAFVVNFGGWAIRDPWRWLPPDLRCRLSFVPKPQVVAVPSSVSVIDTSAM